MPGDLLSDEDSDGSLEPMPAAARWSANSPVPGAGNPTAACQLKGGYKIHTNINSESNNKLCYSPTYRLAIQFLFTLAFVTESNY